MTPVLRIVALTSLWIGLLAFGCGGKVLEQDTSAAVGGGGSGTGGASAGGSSTGGHAAGKGGSGIGGQSYGGSSGSSGSVGTTGACNNPSDIELLNTGYEYVVLFQATGMQCWHDCFKDLSTVNECVYSCVQNITGGKLSPACTACLATESECVAHNCFAACTAYPIGAECSECRCGKDALKTTCAAQFTFCSGTPQCAGY